MRVKSVIAGIALVAGMVAGAARAQEGASPARWYKGNLHTHSLWSDGDQFPELIAEWYRDHGYDFLAMSDHNTNGQGEKWMKVAEIRKRGAGEALEKYKTRFGEKVKVRGEGEAAVEVRLRPLDEYRGDVESARFILIQAEEISGRFEKKPVHINAINVGETIQPMAGKSVREVAENNLRQIEEQEKRTGRPILAHLNHPNFQWGVTPGDVAEIPGEKFFEIWNGHPQINYQGDKDHIDMERWWDVANVIRMERLGMPPLMGLANDDGHHYHVGGMNRSTTGRGWVMVKAEKLNADEIIRAMRRGDFYASSGVALKDVKYDAAKGEVRVEIEPEEGAKYVTRFVGAEVREGATKSGALDEKGVGVVFAEVAGNVATYRLTGKEMYVRAVVVSDQAHPNPTFEKQVKMAWTQPVGWEKRVEKK